MKTAHANGVISGQGPVDKRRPDHPEDFGRGPFWRLAELFFLGVILPSPPPVPQIRFGDEYDDEFQA
jgi:hypothetical protein